MVNLQLEKDKTSEYIARILQKSGQNVNLCYQCNKCAAGCPLVSQMDYTPTQIIHAARLGMMDLVLNSKTIWLCVSCETCTTRCPQDIDIVKVMDIFRIIAVRKGVKPAVPEILMFFKLTLWIVRIFGCIYEAALASLLMLRTGALIKEIPLAIEMLKKHKLRIMPPLRDIITINKIYHRIKKLEKGMNK